MMLNQKVCYRCFNETWANLELKDSETRKEKARWLSNWNIDNLLFCPYDLEDYGDGVGIRDVLTDAPDNCPYKLEHTVLEQ